GEKQWREVVDAFCADDDDWHKLTNSNNELIALLSQVLCKQADRIAELESRTVKLPRPGFITISGERIAVYLKGDVDAAMLAAGIEEAE
ncbi:TPA: ead/Ea22-like family protein, partial [Klebsiella oxytoca]|nr:ead/Ea22-like family protein [Klebsiella oxytoca]